MAEEDEEKTAFHTSQRVYCYTKMPFGLKNAGATYQRLVDKAFAKQVGRNLEVYVDDLVVKSHTEEEFIKDIDETLSTLRKINMKLNPKKCTFGAVEGKFLGYIVGPEGIKPCPEKVDAVLQLPSSRIIKEVQSLNGKLAGLNRFLSKSAEKSLPLFKTLKNCAKKSDFHWTAEAEKAFKELKQHLSKLPTLVASRPMEELIMYLSASHGAVGAVLMTERNTVQTPIYFVSRALQGPELNYTPVEKLVLALVFAAKRLRRYFQAHPIVVLTDQPLRQIMSNPDTAGRMQKWCILLGEHTITYRPRASVKGQILADFLVEKPDEAPTDTSVKPPPREASWTLFTDGSSCIDGSGAGLILTSPEGTEYPTVLCALLSEEKRCNPFCRQVVKGSHGNEKLEMILDNHCYKCFSVISQHFEFLDMYVVSDVFTTLNSGAQISITLPKRMAIAVFLSYLKVSALSVRKTKCAFNVVMFFHMGPTSVDQKRKRSENHGVYGRKRMTDQHFSGHPGGDVEPDRGRAEGDQTQIRMGPTSVGQKRNTSEIQGRYGRRRTKDHHFPGGYMLADEIRDESWSLAENFDAWDEAALDKDIGS
ncbi:reverse transcriptase domain-containing protein [Tanacetum coccineum]